MAKILIVDQNVSRSQSLAETLKEQRFSVDLVHDVDDARQYLKQYRYDAALFQDTCTPHFDLKLCEEVRRLGLNMAVLVLSNSDSPRDLAQALNAGADDYLIWPFATCELVARLQAILRRGKGRTASVAIKVADLVVDLSRRQAYCQGHPLRLPPREFDLLEFFARHPDQSFTLDALLERLKSPGEEVTKNSLSIALTRLKKKLEVSGRHAVLRSEHRGTYVLRSSPD